MCQRHLSISINSPLDVWLLWEHWVIEWREKHQYILENISETISEMIPSLLGIALESSWPVLEKSSILRQMGEAVKPTAVLSEAPCLEYYLADKAWAESSWFWDTQVPTVFSERSDSSGLSCTCIVVYFSSCVVTQIKPWISAPFCLFGPNFPITQQQKNRITFSLWDNQQRCKGMHTALITLDIYL